MLITLYLRFELTTMKAMMNCETIYNFISQMKIKELNLQKNVSVSSDLKTLNDIFLKCYEEHFLRIEVIDVNKHEVRTKQTIIVANMTKIDMILSFFWLKELNLNIDWFSNMIRWRIDNAKNIRKRIHAMIVESDSKFENFESTFSNKDDAKNVAKNRHNVDITIISQLIFEKYCKQKNVQTFILQFNDMLDIEFSMNDLIIETMMKSSKEILEKYKDFADVFDKINADKLLEHDSQDHAINTKSKMLSFESVYNLSMIELELFKKYLDEFLTKEFIVFSSSFADASILFVKKSKNDLKFCVNYKKLNAITIKNRYSIFLINQLLNRFNDVKKFSKLNIQTTYNFIRIKKKNEWKTAFRCRYEQYEYRVMSFELANAFVTFQSYINFALRKFLDVFVIIYLNDILIYSQNEQKHTNHVQFVLKRLRKYKLFAKLSKCDFDLKEVDYLKFIVEINDIRMNLARIAIVKKWIELTTRRHVRTFLKFVEFYRRFIEKFNKIIKSLTNLLKEKKKEEFDKEFEFTEKARIAFAQLKDVFIKTSILLHFDSKRKIRLKIDASDFAISEILFQLIEKTNQWHFVTFFFRKMFVAEQNYEIEKVEMLVVIESCRVFRHYVEDALFSVQMLIDHVNFNTFFKNKELNKKKARWWEKLNDLNLHIEYKSNKQNSADDSFRRLDYESNESIIVNAITNNVNELIMSRVHVHAFNVERDSLMNRDDESSSTLFSMKKNRQFSSNSKTANRMNIENDFIRDKNFESTASHAYINLVVRTRILSTKELVFAIQTKAFDARFDSRSFEIKKQHEKFKKTFCFVVEETENIVSKKAIKKIVLKDINFTKSSIELRIVLKILQKSDQFAQKRMT